MKQILLSMSLLLWMVGCAPHYPMGLDEETWNKLSPQKRAELLEQEAIQNAKQRALEEKLRHEERMRELEIEAQREARLKRLYERAGYGDIVRVNISGGCVRIYKTCEPYRPVSLLVARGETKRTVLKTRYSELDLWVRYDTEGVLIDDDQDLNDFDTAIFLPEHWKRGRAYRLILKDPYQKEATIQNARLYIRYFPTAVTTSNCR